mmetsp:Transcript_13662/g.22613  ORF Transcript_13662/g.22613 Transcript_13662/m.22613 type:complete len:85 (+) Transcript_13662:23-277(+)
MRITTYSAIVIELPGLCNIGRQDDLSHSLGGPLKHLSSYTVSDSNRRRRRPSPATTIIDRQKQQHVDAFCCWCGLDESHQFNCK